MYNDILLIGCLLLAMFVVCAAWHIRENNRLESELLRKTDANTAEWLVRFAWSRTLQLLVALGCIMVVFISYDRRLNESKDSLAILTETMQKKDKIEKERFDALKQQLQQELASKKVSAPVIITNPVAPVVTQAAQEAPATSLAEEGGTKTRRSRNNETIEALYNPEKTQTDKQSSMDDIKKRYEDIIVIHLFLKKCNKIQPDDFAIISYALSQEMTAVDAPKKLRNDIIDAAKGSYDEIYAKSSCKGSGIGELSTQYTNYVKILADNFTRH